MPAAMFSLYEWHIGWRYVRAGRAGRRNGFISFIAFISMAGIALGVAALIIVLSVMNGFQRDVRNRMLSVVPHLEVADAAGQALADWRQTADAVRAATPTQTVQGAAPFMASQMLLSRRGILRGAMVRGIDPAAEAEVTPIAAQLQHDVFARLEPGRWQVVLGAELAAQLGVQVGDSLTLMAPSGQVTPAGLVPRLRNFTVAGTFASGHYDYDSTLALIHLEDAARLMRTGGPTGVQFKLADQLAAREVAAELKARLPAELAARLTVRDWTRSNASWYDAVQVEKRLMGIILTLIVAVAAFNLVSTLVMTVTDKQSDIAILRTLGASPRSVMGVFVVQGAAAGVLGTLVGVGLGLLVAHNVEAIAAGIERALSFSFFPPSIYLISRMPSDPQWRDVLPITVIALVLSLVATLYPSWRASRVNPAQALRYE
jgi:lipoprotein-releasing system permease protein